MLLIVFLVLTAKLALVSGDCNLGTPTLHHFDYSKFSGPRLWYTLKHSSDLANYNGDCPRMTFSVPEGDRSIAAIDYYDKSANVHRSLLGYITNWNSTGYMEYSFELPYTAGRILVIAVDYDRYYIYKRCREGTNEPPAPPIFVDYRSPHPDQETVNAVNRVLKGKHMHPSQLVNISVDHCPST